VESRKYISWFQTQGAKALNHTSEDADSQWTHCRFVVARSEDKCFIGSWIFARSPLHVRVLITLSDTHLDTLFIRMVNLLLAVSLKFWQMLRATALSSVLDVFQILAARHEIFGMPMLARETTTYVAIPSTVCLCYLLSIQ
jgi:hypothetical protein